MHLVEDDALVALLLQEGVAAPHQLVVDDREVGVRPDVVVAGHHHLDPGAGQPLRNLALPVQLQAGRRDDQRAADFGDVGDVQGLRSLPQAGLVGDEDAPAGGQGGGTPGDAFGLKRAEDTTGVIETGFVDQTVSFPC